MRLKEGIDGGSRIELQTVGVANLNALRPTALVVGGTCKRFSEDERMMNGWMNG